jgi:hypothetical protein
VFFILLVSAKQKQKIGAGFLFDASPVAFDRFILFGEKLRDEQPASKTRLSSRSQIPQP